MARISRKTAATIHHNEKHEMPTRRSRARWEGGLKGGKGTFTGESGAIGGQYNFSSCFEEGVG